jgi:hypothetical protein
MMQPTFLPWQGYFGLVAASDVFILLDDFQFMRRSFHHRNRLLFADEGAATVSLPVKRAPGGNELPIVETVVAADAKWRRHLLAKIDHSYRTAAHYDTFRDPIAAWINGEWPNLAALNIAFITMVADWLGDAPEWRRSSELDADGKRSERNLELLRAVDAGTYLSARGSFEYMRDDALFPVDDIEVVFQDFEPVPYAQRAHEPFESHLSVLDTLFEVGADGTRALIEQGQRSWLSWDEMAATAAATRVAP